ncbi:MAG: UDP-glucose 4-epimerase GalE [Spirochaetia bacterium]|jgi:UDP-glucose 4-epimerase|nr:UDP-glucose 4-epimerase GalE [Spirochaetia bacterium]
MKVLIIGGAGYIGSHVARLFADSGLSVDVADNLSTGRRDNLFPEYGFFQGDILDYPWLEGLMKRGGYNAVVHLAAAKAAGESMIVPQKYATQNIAGTINILNAACEAGIEALVFSSSAAVYGEPAYLPVDEEHPKEPENFYGFTKLEIERFLAWYEKLKGLKFAALRYFNAAGYDPEGRVYGLEKNPANLIPVIMEVAAGIRPKLQVFGTDYPTRDGSGVRDYVHVSDLAQGHLLALDYVVKQKKSLTVNLGSESGLSVLEILEAARRISGKTIPADIVERRPGDPASLVASSGKARALLGWKARYSDLDSLIFTSWKAYSRGAD